MASVVEKTDRMNAPERAALPPRRAKEIVEARAAARLRTSPYAEVRRIACEFHEGMLCLRGRVPSYYLKQLAQTVVLAMDSVDAINNQLEVATPPPAGKQDVLPAGSFRPRAFNSMGGVFHKEDE